jgi:hypothetical protein
LQSFEAISHGRGASQRFDNAFVGRKGITALSMNWQDASGHIAMLNGTTYREAAHVNFATYVNLINSNIGTQLGEFWEQL